MKTAIKRALRKFGYEIVQLPGPETLGSHLMRLFDRLEIECVLDVGAYFGEFGRYLRRHGYAGNLISFEPISGNVARLRESAENDKFWRIETLALGSTNGRSTINVTSGSDLSSFFAPNEYCGQRFPNQADILAREPVEVRRLDSIFDDLVGGDGKSKVYLKMDTQGFDLEVMNGATACLGRIAALQSEITVVPIYDGLPTYLESLGYLASIGFYPSAFFPVNRTADSALIDFDCIMVHR
jgi:FkbM family methyltransferase